MSVSAQQQINGLKSIHRVLKPYHFVKHGLMRQGEAEHALLMLMYAIEALERAEDEV